MATTREIIDAFGGAAALSRALSDEGRKVDYRRVHRWIERGISHQVWPELLALASKKPETAWITLAALRDAEPERKSEGQGRATGRRPPSARKDSGLGAEAA